MASHSYGAMLINGGVVHNGDKVSVVENKIEKAFFLTDRNHVDVAELVTKLSSAIQQYDTLRDHLRGSGSGHKDLVSLLNDIQDLQSALSTLRTIIEDPQLEDLNSSDDCLHPILEVSQRLDEYQFFIEEFRTNLEFSSSGQPTNDRRTTELTQSQNEVRWKVNHLRDKLNNTIVVANICIQRRFQAQSVQHMDELKALRALVETDSERRLLSSLPTTLPLKRWDLERARLNDDPEFTLRRYLESLALQRPIISHPSTPSMQGSSIAPSSTTGIISFVTARERQSLAGTVQDTYVSTFQVFIRGLPQFKSFVLQVDQHDTIDTVKYKIKQQIDFDADYSLSHHNRLLNDGSMVSANLIHNLDTLHVVPKVRTGQARIEVTTLGGATDIYFKDSILAEFRDLTVQDLKKNIHKCQGIPEAQQRLIWGGEQLKDSVLLHTITTRPVVLVRRLIPVMEDQNPETSLGSVDCRNTAPYGTDSSRSSKRMGRGIRMLTVRRRIRAMN